MSLPYLLYFLSGVLLEYTVLYFFFMGKDFDIFSVCVAINLFSHPLLIYVVPGLGTGYLTTLLISELFIIIGEGFLMTEAFSFSWKEGLKGSLFANIFSWQFAPFVVHVLGFFV